MIRAMLVAAMPFVAGCTAPSALVVPAIPCDAKHSGWCVRCWQEDATDEIERQSGSQVLWPINDCR